MAPYRSAQKWYHKREHRQMLWTEMWENLVGQRNATIQDGAHAETSAWSPAKLPAVRSWQSQPRLMHVCMTCQATAEWRIMSVCWHSGKLVHLNSPTCLTCLIILNIHTPLPFIILDRIIWKQYSIWGGGMLLSASARACKAEPAHGWSPPLTWNVGEQFGCLSTLWTWDDAPVSNKYLGHTNCGTNRALWWTHAFF